MNHNLAKPYGDSCSPPQSPYLAFYSPASDDLLFTSEGTIEIRCQAGLRSSALQWTLHRNMVKTPFREGQAEAVPGNRYIVRLDTADFHPGFYDLRVTLNSGIIKQDGDPLGKRPVTSVCTFGWQVEQMALADTRPDDFVAFWEQAKADLATIPLDAEEEPLTAFGPDEIDEYNLSSAALFPDYDPDGHRSETVHSGKVNFAGPDGGRVYGWLAKPDGDGPFPAMLILPGAGFAARPRPLEHARHGYLSMDIQVHGQDVDLEDYPTLPSIHAAATCEDPSEHYYFNVHLRCLQAVTYLASRPDVDASRIVVVGGSQGGRLGIVVAGIDSRISAVVSAIANSPNHPHLQWIAKCNGLTELGGPRQESTLPLSDGMELNGAPPVREDRASRCFAYFDPMNYAEDIRCPTLMNCGLIDPVSPPSSVWAVYNRLGTATKMMTPVPGHGHDWFAEFDRRAWHWLDEVLGNQAL